MLIKKRVKIIREGEIQKEKQQKGSDQENDGLGLQNGEEQHENKEGNSFSHKKELCHQLAKTKNLHPHYSTAETQDSNIGCRQKRDVQR